jgi:regulator of protease activity HflC (stomatin/prohibitin superfamily)
MRFPFFLDFVQEWDLRVLVADLQSQSVRTKDGVSLAVSGALRYRVTDVDRATMSVKNLRRDLTNLASAAIGISVNVLEDKDITMAKLQDHVSRVLTAASAGWGIKVESVYLIDLSQHRALRVMGETAGDPEKAMLDLM